MIAAIERGDYKRLVELPEAVAGPSMPADPARPSPADFTATVNTALAALARAERHCTLAQAQALRRRLMGRLARWL